MSSTGKGRVSGPGCGVFCFLPGVRPSVGMACHRGLGGWPWSRGPLLISACLPPVPRMPWTWPPPLVLPAVDWYAISTHDPYLQEKLRASPCLHVDLATLQERSSSSQHPSLAAHPPAYTAQVRLEPPASRAQALGSRSIQPPSSICCPEALPEGVCLAEEGGRPSSRG